nr:alpha/beta fold hydrolase [Veillonella denticariosi]
MQRMYIDLGSYRYGLTIVGTGEPLVCLHGFSESGYTWNGITLPGYRMIRIDTIGHGDSDVPDDEMAYTIPVMLEDLHTVLYHVAGESYHLMGGYSMGGARLALLYTLQYESEVKRLILESGSVALPRILDVRREDELMKSWLNVLKLTMGGRGLRSIGRKRRFLHHNSDFHRSNGNSYIVDVHITVRMR